MRNFEFKTLKRCPPFLDAMSTGWILPLAADIQFNIQDDGTGLTMGFMIFIDLW